MQVFVPYSDSMLEQLSPQDRLVPYQVGVLVPSRVNAGVLQENLNRDQAPACRPAEPQVPRPSPR